MACIHEQDVERYHDGALPPDLVATTEAHLAACPDCRALLSELQALSARLANAELAAMPGDLTARVCAAASMGRLHPAANQLTIVRLAGWLTAAAAAVLLATLVGWPSTSADDSLALATWESLAVSPSLATAETNGDSELIVLAQWMADELSTTSKRSSE